MGSVRALRMDAELVGEELDRGAHPEALVRSNVIVHRFPLPPRFLHTRHIDLPIVALPPFLPECPVHPLDMPIEFRTVRREHPERNRLCLTFLLELGHELAPAVDL